MQIIKQTQQCWTFVNHRFSLIACIGLCLHALFLVEAVFAEDSSDQAEVRQGPQRVSPAEHGVGRFVPDVDFKDLSGKSHHLKDFRQQKLTVLAMTSTSCPLSKKYQPTLTELAKHYSPDKVAFLLVNPVSVDDLEQMKIAQQQLPDGALYIPDAEMKLAAAMGTVTTTDVIVLDADRTIVYHGAIDDQYGFGYALDAPRHRYLADALDALLNGLQPAITATEAPGCMLDLPKGASDKQTGDAVAEQPSLNHLTWYNRVERIIQQNCVECHRAGGVAPFSLESSKEVIAHGAMIKEVLDRGIMPPWFAAPPEAGHVSPWSNERALVAEEKRDLLAWLESDHALGNAKDGAKPRKFPDGWSIGEPDVVFGFAKPVPVKATGTMPYQNVMIETDLPADRWVQAIEVRPGAREVVHHVVVSIVGSSSPAGDSRDVAAEERRGFWALYVPGSSKLVYPSGYAKLLPRGARLRFQMHYTPNGTATEDVTQIGMVFAKQPPQHEVKVLGIVNPRLKIPAGAANHEETASKRLPVDAEILAFLPHMHLRGKACRYDLIEKSGETRTLLDVPRYDFNWQLLYRFAEPQKVSAGDTLRFTAWFDNSEQNPANPDPTKTVRWGPQTSDEMHLGYVEYVLPQRKGDHTAGEAKAAGSKENPEPNRTLLGMDIEVLFKRVDQDKDNSISETEFFAATQTTAKLRDKPDLQKALWARLNTDKNETLSLEEFEKLLEIIKRGR